MSSHAVEQLHTRDCVVARPAGDGNTLRGTSSAGLTDSTLTGNGLAWPSAKLASGKLLAGHVCASAIHLELAHPPIAFVCRPQSLAPAGWDEISRLRQLLEDDSFTPRGFLILPLHSMVPPADQKAVFRPAPPGVRKVCTPPSFTMTCTHCACMTCSPSAFSLLLRRHGSKSSCMTAAVLVAGVVVIMACGLPGTLVSCLTRSAVSGLP